MLGRLKILTVSRQDAVETSIALEMADESNDYENPIMIQKIYHLYLMKNMALSLFVYDWSRKIGYLT